jgi:hypothetical protein
VRIQVAQAPLKPAPQHLGPELTACVRECYLGNVLVEVRKQSVAGPIFRGASEARVKGAAAFSAEVADGSPAEAAGGLG